MDNNIQICDLTKIIPPKRIIKIEEKQAKENLLVRQFRRILGIEKKPIIREIDISRVPTRVSIEIEKYFREFGEATAKNDFEKVEQRMFDIMVDVCKPSFPEITTDWVKENTIPEQIQEMFQFIIEPIILRAAGLEENVKNAIAAQLAMDRKK
jgi:hypothetical protein